MLALLLVVLFFVSYIRIYIGYKEELYAYVSLFGVIRYKIYPEKKKVRTMSPKQLKKLGGKLKKKKKSKSAKKSEEKAKPTVSSTVRDIKEIVRELYDLLSAILKRFAYKVKIRVKRIDITVATDDAAVTALTYSAVCNALDVLVDMLLGYDKVKCNIDHIDCRCDYLADKFSINADIMIKVRIIHMLGISVGILIDYFKRQNNGG